MAAGVAHSMEFTLPGGEKFADLTILENMSDVAPDLSEDELRDILEAEIFSSSSSKQFFSQR